jgi:hypothetical protein
MPNKLPFLPDEFHYAIAHVATRAAQLDHTLEISVDVQFKPLEEMGEYLIKSMDTNRLVQVLQRLLRNNFKNRLDEIETLISQITTARTERNELLHWLWGQSDDPELPKYGQLRPYRPKTEKQKTAEEIFSIADSMLSATKELAELNTEHLNNLIKRDERARPSFGTLAP